MNDAPDLIARARFEASEDRRIAAIARQDHTRATLLQRAKVTDDLIAALREAEAKLTAIREDVGADRTGWYEVHRSHIHALLEGREP